MDLDCLIGKLPDHTSSA